MVVDRSSARVLAVLVAALLCAISFVITLSGSDSDFAQLEALARALVVAAPLGVGLYLSWGPPPLQRFGWLLVVSGAGWFLTTLAASDVALPHSLGRVTAWLMQPFLWYLALAFPTGRLQDRGERALILAAVVVAGVLYVPSALLVEAYPDPSPWSSCGDGCPANALMVVGSEPAWIDDVLRPIRELLALGLFLAVAVRLARRVRGASPLMRRMLTPVAQIAAVLGLLGAVILMTRIATDADRIVRAVSWVQVAVSIAFSVAFLVGALRWRLFIGRCLERLSILFRVRRSREELATMLAEAFEDLGLELVDPAAASDPGPGRVRTDIRVDSEVVAVVHDAALCDEQAFIEAAASAALASLDRQDAGAARLARRVLAGADDERQRIQRDLHDGAQQRLLALRVRLELAADQPSDSEALRGFARDVDAAVAEVSGFARGVYPPLLSSRGLVEALRSAARESALPTRVNGDHIGRYPPEIERAAYFCGLEAMQNASKHARGATAVSVRVVDDGKLRLEIHDDGGGFDVTATPPGMGLANMRDRVASVGGELDLRSCPTDGTSVLVALPTEG